MTSAVECMQIGERIGIVKFSTYAYTLLNMTTITSDPAVRKYIESKIPTQPEDNTAIGRGILLGLTVRKEN